MRFAILWEKGRPMHCGSDDDGDVRDRKCGDLRLRSLVLSYLAGRAHSRRGLVWSKGCNGVKTFIPATEPPDPRKVLEGVREGVSEGFLKGSRRVLVLVSRRTLQNPLKTLQEPFENLSRRC